MNRFAVILGGAAALFLVANSSAIAYQPYGMQYASYHMPYAVNSRFPYQRPQLYYPAYQYRYPIVNQPSAETRSRPESVIAKAKTLAEPAKTVIKPEISRQDEKIQSNVPTSKSMEVEVTEVSQSKMLFIEKLIPLIEEENERLQRLRQEVMSLIAAIDVGQSINEDEVQNLKSLATNYRIKGNPVSDAQVRSSLLERVDIIPVSLTLAQAANESAWGKSRFAQEGNNLFGIWTYDPDKGIVPKGREKGAKHLVRKFDSLQASVRYYMHNLNSHPAYESLRKIRAQQRQLSGSLDGIALAEGLEKYSAKGKIYIRLIQEIIEKNNLAALDVTSGNA